AADIVKTVSIIKIAMGHLPARMHARIRSSGARQRNPVASNPRQAVAQDALDCAQARLGGPAVKVGAVVGDIQTQSHYSPPYTASAESAFVDGYVIALMPAGVDLRGPGDALFRVHA